MQVNLKDGKQVKKNVGDIFIDSKGNVFIYLGFLKYEHSSRFSSCIYRITRWESNFVSGNTIETPAYMDSLLKQVIEMRLRNSIDSRNIWTEVRDKYYKIGLVTHYDETTLKKWYKRNALIGDIELPMFKEDYRRIHKYLTEENLMAGVVGVDGNGDRWVLYDKIGKYYCYIRLIYNQISLSGLLDYISKEVKKYNNLEKSRTSNRYYYADWWECARVLTATKSVKKLTLYDNEFDVDSLKSTIVHNGVHIQDEFRNAFMKIIQSKVRG